MNFIWLKLRTVKKIIKVDGEDKEVELPILSNAESSGFQKDKEYLCISWGLNIHSTFVFWIFNDEGILKQNYMEDWKLSRIDEKNKK